MALRNTTFLDACRGHQPAHTPLWIMRQAGRYLPEYREVRAKVSFLELCRTPELCAKVTLQPIDRFGLDAAILFSDILTVVEVFGIEIDFDPGPQIATPVRTADDIAGLELREVDDTLSYVFDAVRACKSALEDRVPLIGFAGAPFTTVSYLIEGSSTKDFRHTKSLMWREPEAFATLLGQMTDVTAMYLTRQVEAGADALQIFESWGGALAPADYMEHVWPHLERLLKHALALGVPVIAFPRGNANLLARLAPVLPAGGDLVVGIDWALDLGRALDILGPDRVVQGNLDPMLLFAPPDVLRARARAVVETGRRARGHVFNLGHGISRHTDPAQVQILVDAVHGA